MTLKNNTYILTSGHAFMENNPQIASQGKRDNGPIVVAPPTSNVTNNGFCVSEDGHSTTPSIFIPPMHESDSALGRLPFKKQQGKPRLDPIPDSPHLKRASHEGQRSDETNPDVSLNSTDMWLFENDSRGRTGQSLLGVPPPGGLSGDPLRRSFRLRKLEPETSYPRDSASSGVPWSLKKCPEQQHGSLNSGQILRNASLPDTEDRGSTQDNLTLPRDFTALKARSESALSSINPDDEAMDRRRNSSDNYILTYPPDSLISSHPRRDSAWTAEVLSIEIQVDYVMDPDDLWGRRMKRITPAQVSF